MKACTQHWTTHRAATDRRKWARLSITVARDDVETVRVALFRSLYGHIKQLVVVLDVERGTREPTATLQVVLDRDAVDEALKVAMARAPGARPGNVLAF